MNKPTDTKKRNSSRISARISDDLYEKFMKAVEISGVSLNAFIVQTLNREADEVIDRYNYQSLKVSRLEDALWFKQQIEGPALSNKRLKRAFTSYKELLHDSSINKTIRRIN
ncbi:DUF1778 domain-containing protein [Acinetobacter sp. ANC 3791]|uniref:type II toxin-antitoxin system TacA family antitoxin n=1 Tax=Acinetobacter sp. ANC 3791 TaxID=2529836 RepID=UPI00103EDA06|nr:DUF1778 domain-containing protein [Acinetobacter sp. ANC 3791]TCB80889.1 DUF1778 domain-containing protein [Acinetobacter sp. ANC 3791]